MRNWVRGAAELSLVALVAGLGVAGMQAKALAGPPKIKAGQTAPAWSAKTIQGKAISSAQYQGKPVLLNFFGFTCTACRQEYPHLQTLQQRYSGKGFTVLSVSDDEKPEVAGTFAREVKATFPVIHDPEGKIFDAYTVGELPTNVIVGRNGKVLKIVEGLDLKALDAAVGAAVNGK